MEPAVAYACVATAHRAGGGGPDKLTVHEGEWAFCPFDAKADGHQWSRTRGTSLSALRHAAGLRQREPSPDRSRAGAR